MVTYSAGSSFPVKDVAPGNKRRRLQGPKGRGNLRLQGDRHARVLRGARATQVCRARSRHPTSWTSLPCHPHWMSESHWALNTSPAF